MLEIYSGNTIYKFGTITAFSDSFTKSVMTTPIVSLPTDCTFPLETGATLTYTASFSRVSPMDYDDNSEDSDKWCNATWVERVCTLANRWQARTDGYMMVFRETDVDGKPNPYVPQRKEKVYIKKLTIDTVAGYTDLVTGSIQFKVGSARSSVSIPAPDVNVCTREEISVNNNSSYVILTAPNQSKQYMLQYGGAGKGSGAADYLGQGEYGIDCINSYKVSGGPGAPFESIQLRISRKKLTELYPELGESADSTFSKDILAGKSQVIFSGVGSGVMTVSSCKMTSDEYTITAYCKAEVLRGTPIGNTMVSLAPLQFIHQALSGAYGVSCEVVTYLNPNHTTAQLTFASTTTVWQALQICAAALNSKIFFANNKAYVIDYSLGPNTFSVLELYPEDGQTEYGSLRGLVLDKATYGNEGQDSIVNQQAVRYDANAEPDVAESRRSKDTYSVREGYIIDIAPYLTITTDAALNAAKTVADIMGNHIVSYCDEPQKSVSFTVRENMTSAESEGAWSPVFPLYCCAGKISSSVDGIVISNKSQVIGAKEGEVRHQKLFLTQYERRYPEHTAEYTFGILSGMDLQDVISKIQKG